MKKISFLLLLIGVNFTSYAMDSLKNRQEQLINQLLSQQVQQNISIENSVGSLIKRYPENAQSILKLAFKKYPNQYEAIISSTIHAEPALSAAAVTAALQANVAECHDIVKIAINAEPAYANEIIQAAIRNSADPIQNIVRVAVSTEPFISDSIIENIKNENSESMLNVFIGIIKALPDHVVSLVKKTLKLYPKNSEAVVTKAIYSSKSKFDQQIVEAAVKSGLTKERAIAAAIKGGAKEEKFALL